MEERELEVWSAPVIPAFKRLRQKKLNFEASLDYTVRT
jgi:hypothetical protein